MKEWETDDEISTKPSGVASLTSGNELCSRTPSAKSKRSSRRTMTPSPSAMAGDRNDKRSSRDITNDPSISILDPRRFTPTLHANLVSEILALRRDQDEKTRQIESLESALHSAKEEYEQLQQNLTNTSKESRSLKRQISLLEGGTSSALGELARERDEAVDSITDAKKRLDAAQKKMRCQEDDSQRVHDLWAQEKNDWEDERRKYERKLHIAESRLKMVLDEVAAYQASQAGEATNGNFDDHDTDGDDGGGERDAASVRTMSMSNSIRHSLLNGPILQPGSSLADELNFDDDDDTDADGRESVLSYCTSPKHTRSYSRDSASGRFHRRNYSVESPKRLGGVARSKLTMNPAVLEALEGEDEHEEEPEVPPPFKASYTDTGVQYSPPPSEAPRFVSPPADFSPQRGKTPESDSPARADGEVEANQRRKRVQLNRPLMIERPKPDHEMISTSAQTIEMPLSPPKTPHSPRSEKHTLEPSHAMASTQTNEPLPVSIGVAASTMRATGFPPPQQIPTISIQPPTSRPTTPMEQRLPQHFKHFGCQVNLSSNISISDAGVQTEGIQVDKRIALLPPHLQPSTISSRPTSPNPSKSGVHQEQEAVPSSTPPRNPRRLTDNHGMPDFPSSPITSREDDSYLGLADDHLPSNKRTSKRANRFSSIFAGFDTASSDEGDDFADADVSDSEYRTALSAPRPQSLSKRVTRRGSFGTVTASPEQIIPKFAAVRGSAKLNSTEGSSSFNLADKENYPKGHGRKLSRKYEKTPAPPPPSSGSSLANRTSAIRRAAMIQSGIASQQSCPISPRFPDGQQPPFPIPTRDSSRRSQVDLSAPSDGRESPTRGELWHRRGSSRSSHQSHSIRKVRSAAALPRAPRLRRHGSRSPPPLSPSTEAPESPGLPPLPQNDITTPRTGRDRGPSNYRRHRHDLSTNTDNTYNTNYTALTTDTGASHTTGVVDAIAQAMVGEWMLKYVRRRRSFSVPENSGKDDSSNDRHKRWVWLAPYERSILWSSKQPSSGSALLGKTGRKLMIQSVLDVKDDNPAPKVMPTVFNRSILILTPQRALKFTANSAERHFLWLTALSFLAHSSQALPENISAPNPQPHVKQQEFREFEPPQPKLKRGGIRDSIRLAKRKSSTSKIGTTRVPSIVSVPSSRMSEATGSRIPDSSSAISGGHSREQSREAAEPPFVPRFSERSAHVMATHGRKRSNTGGHVAPPLSFRGFSGPAGTTSSAQNSGQGSGNGSADATVSLDTYQTQGSTNETWNMSQTASQRTSEASSGPGNFFDAIGTVRMEAFISPLAYSQSNEFPTDRNGDYRRSARRRSKEFRRRGSRNRHGDNHHNQNPSHIRSSRVKEDDNKKGKYQVEEDYFLRDDPFKGF